MRVKTPSSEAVEIEFEGKKYEAYEGEPIAIGLLSNGIRRLATSTMGRKRGAFYVGPAPVEVNGKKRINPRTTPIRKGMRIKRGNYRDYETSVEDVETKVTSKIYEVVIVGGGPAGLGAAREISDVATSAIIEMRPYLGGLAYLREYEKLNEWTDVKSDVYLKTTVIGIFDRGEYLLIPAVRGNELIEFYAKRAILATGAVDATMLFENNDMPGLFRASLALETIVRRGVKPGENVAVVGREPELVSHILSKYGIDYVHIRYPKAVYGDEHVREIEDFNGEKFEVDAVIVSDGRRPDINPITQPGGRIRLSNGYFVPITDERMRIKPRIYVAGSAYRIYNDHNASYLSGRLVGAYVLKDLGYESDPGRYEEDLAKASIKSYEIDPIPIEKLDLEKTFICGCDVTLKSVYDVVKAGIVELQIVKRLTHFAMGFCQGRYCLFNGAKVVSQLSGRSITELDIPVARPPLRYTKMGTLAYKYRGE